LEEKKKSGGSIEWSATFFLEISTSVGDIERLGCAPKLAGEASEHMYAEAAFEEDGI
jgi:hypothetical protein